MCRQGVLSTSVSSWPHPKVHLAGVLELSVISQEPHQQMELFHGISIDVHLGFSHPSYLKSLFVADGKDII